MRTSIVCCLLSVGLAAHGDAGAADQQGQAAAFRTGGRAMARATILSAKDARHWANELARILERATGVRPPANASPQAGDLVIHVGLTDYVRSRDLDFAGLHPCGYYLKLAEGNNLILAGRTREATGYAVFDFAKRFLGYRSFMPGEIGEIIPKTAIVVLPQTIDVRTGPDILSYTVAWGHRDPFERASRTTLLATHWLAHIYPPAKYAREHPEYYPTIGGHRFVPPPTQGGTWQPCVSNPELPAIAAEYARGWFQRDKPDSLGFSVGVNDGGGDCQCEKCLAWRQQFGNQYIPFYNAVARLTAREFPDKLVCFIAYGRGASPVPHDIEIHPSLLVQICGLRNDFELFKAWKRAGAKNFGLYDYMYGTGYVVPRHYPHIVANAWRRAYKEFGLKALWQEFYPSMWLYNSARQYVLNELAWDIHADVDALLDDYFARMYAEAARPMRQFFDRVEAVYGRKKDPLAFSADWQRLSQLEEYEWDDLAYLQQRLAEAKAAVKEPDAGRRLALFDRIFGLSALYLESYLCAKDLRACSVVRDEKQIQALLDAAARGLRAARAVDAYTMPQDDEKQIFTAKCSLEAFRNLPTAKPGPLVEQLAESAFQKITTLLLGKGDWASVRQFWKQTAARTPDSQLRALALTPLYTRESPDAAVNLVKNPGFEPAEGKDDLPDSAAGTREWEKLLPGIPGWGTWHFQQSVTQFYLDAREAHTGKHSASIRENQIAGCFQTSVSVTPGCRYRVSFWVKQTPPDKGGALTVRWMKKGGGWADEGDKAVPRLTVPFPREETSAWRQVSTTFTAVDPCTSCILLLGAPCQGPDEAVWFDDVEMVKIYDPSFFREEQPASPAGNGPPLPPGEGGVRASPANGSPARGESSGRLPAPFDRLLPLHTRLCYATGADPPRRFTELAAFSRREGLRPEQAFYEKSLAVLEGAK